jgi:phosphohistidine phosphatase SixA
MIDLIVCSICLRARRGAEWLAAEHVFRDHRSYDDELPRLDRAVCDDCAEAISRRRADGEDAVAA